MLSAPELDLALMLTSQVLSTKSDISEVCIVGTTGKAFTDEMRAALAKKKRHCVGWLTWIGCWARHPWSY